MPKIILKTGEGDNSQVVSLDAIQGSIGAVPFKCWDKNGSKAFRQRILKRNASSAAFYVLGPSVKGLVDRLERGGRHSARNKRKMAAGGQKGGEKKAWNKYSHQWNIRQGGGGRSKWDRG